MRVHFFFLLCVASRLLALVLWLQHKTEQWRGTGPVCPQLLLPTATMAPVQSPAWLTLGQELPRASLVPVRCCGRHLCCCFTVMMLGRQRGPRVPALAVPSRAPDTPHLQAGERRKPSLSSGMCSCFPSGLQSCARAPLALALPLAECCAIAGLCPRRWGLTGYVFSPLPSGFSPPRAAPARMHSRFCVFLSIPRVNTGGERCRAIPPAPPRCPPPREELAAATISDGVTFGVLFLYPDEIRRLISSPLLFFFFKVFLGPGNKLFPCRLA